MQESDARGDALRELNLGKTYLAKPSDENLLLALEKFRNSLAYLRAIGRKKFTREDAKHISEVLGLLLKSLNQLLNGSQNSEKIVDELGKFFGLYVSCLERFNQNEDVLLGLSALNHLAFGELYRKIPGKLKKEKAFVLVYTAILSLFHDKLVAEENFTCPSDDQTVVKVFQLYERAFPLYQQLEKRLEKLSAAESEKKRAKVEEEEKAAKKPALKKEGQKSPERKTVTFFGAPPEKLQQPAQYVPGMAVFENIAPDGPKQEALKKMKAAENYEGVIKCYPFIINKTAEDYRCVCECYELLAKKYYGLNNYVSALESFKGALQMCKYVLQFNPHQDLNLKARLIDFCFQTVKQAISNWHLNYENTVKAICIFFLMYLENISFVATGLDTLSQCALGSRNDAERNFIKIFSAIVAMFSQSSGRETGWLGHHLHACKAMENSKEPYVVEIWAVFEKALGYVQYPLNERIRPFVNPELSQKIEEDQQQAPESSPQRRNGKK